MVFKNKPGTSLSLVSVRPNLEYRVSLVDYEIDWKSSLGLMLGTHDATEGEEYLKSVQAGFRSDRCQV